MSLFSSNGGGNNMMSEAQKSGYVSFGNAYNRFTQNPLARTNATTNDGSNGADNPYVNNPKRRQPLFKENRFEEQIRR